MNRHALQPTMPLEVAQALRDQAAKTGDRTTAGYLILAADTIHHLNATRPKRKRTPRL